MKIAAVTTFHRAGWNKYARLMVESFHANWPQDVKLYAYAEGCADDCEGALDLDREAPAVAMFKDRNRDPKARGIKDGVYDFRFDAVRFCHKVFAIEAAMHRCKHEGFDALIWVDADVVTHSKIPRDYLDGLLAGADVAYLARHNKHSETGFIVYRTNDLGERMAEAVAEQYRADAMFALKEWHDAFVFDVCRVALEVNWGLKGHSLSDGYEHIGHPFINSTLGQYMDHLKGTARKDAGRSRTRDLVRPRDEAWWR